MKEHSVSVYKWRLLLDFGPIIGFLPRKCLLLHKLLPCVGLYPVYGLICPQWFHLKRRLSSVCSVMSVHFPSYMSCLVSSSLPVIYSYTVVEVVHSYINAFVHSCTHAYTTSFMHDCISRCLNLDTQSPVRPYLFSSVQASHLVCA